MWEAIFALLHLPLGFFAGYGLCAFLTDHGWKR